MLYPCSSQLKSWSKLFFFWIKKFLFITNMVWATMSKIILTLILKVGNSESRPLFAKSTYWKLRVEAWYREANKNSPESRCLWQIDWYRVELERSGSLAQRCLTQPSGTCEDDDHNNPCGQYDYEEGKYSDQIGLSKYFNDYLTVSSSFGGRLVCFPFKVSILWSNSSTLW